ncbi:MULTISPECIES: hypothetical protein [Enterococcus]|uniref:hypothetical protein n=1 Tax=Enterococcus gallinarum TaxID=1353 RepID=UPI0015D0AE2C|nr:hypothetical protein [Enterococcus gallinarum]MBF0726662.1 hypothetical protein [Enterococcus gallinarum]NYS82763.1 hypothetical protein [Enterococcus gallinarum]
MDYLSNFTPFVIEVLKSCHEEYIRKDYVKEKLQKNYSLDIPNGVIEKLLARLEKDNYIITEQIDSRSYVYKPNYELLETSNLLNKKIEFEKNYKELVSEYIKYCSEKHNIRKDEEEAERDILDIIGEKKIDILEAELGNSSFSIKNDDIYSNYLIGTFVKYLNKTESYLYHYLVDIVKGSMLMNVVYFNEKSNVQMKFKETSVYLDTSFIMYALGLSGSDRQAPCTELLNLLQKSGALIKCFSDNVDEIRGILSWTKHNLYQVKDKHDTIQYFLEQDFTDNDIEMLIYSIEEKIKNLGIAIEDICYDEDEYKYNIDEQKFDELLEENLKYGRSKARETDVKTISAIVRMRKGKNYLHIEECKALMITTNKALVSTSAKFFLTDNVRQINPIMHENSVLNLVWIKNPNLSLDLPNKILISNCFSAISPSDRFWSKYLDEIERLSQDGRIITEEDVVTLRYTKLAKEILMETTLGNEERIDSSTIENILNQIETKKNEEKKSIEDEKNKTIDELQRELHERKSKENQKIILRNTKRQKVIHIFFLVTKYSIGILFGGSSYFVSQLNDVDNKISIVILLVFTGLIPALDFLDLFNLKNILSSLENKIQKKFELEIPNPDISSEV